MGGWGGGVECVCISDSVEKNKEMGNKVHAIADVREDAFGKRCSQEGYNVYI